jgi:hypothetical protein
VEEFARDLTDLEIEIRPPRTEQIALRLYKEDIEVLRSLAAARGVGHTTLARTVPSKAGSRGREARGKRRAAGRSAGRPDLLRSDIDYTPRRPGAKRSKPSSAAAKRRSVSGIRLTNPVKRVAAKRQSTPGAIYLDRLGEAGKSWIGAHRLHSWRTGVGENFGHLSCFPTVEKSLRGRCLTAERMRVTGI